MQTLPVKVLEEVKVAPTMTVHQVLSALWFAVSGLSFLFYIARCQLYLRHRYPHGDLYWMIGPHAALVFVCLCVFIHVALKEAKKEQSGPYFKP